MDGALQTGHRTSQPAKSRITFRKHLGMLNKVAEHCPRIKNTSSEHTTCVSTVTQHLGSHKICDH